MHAWVSGVPFFLTSPLSNKVFLIGLAIYSQREEVGRLYNKHTSIFPNEDVLTKEIESWKGFADS